jgi:mono/diheme cytochrome c family protein
MRAGPLVAILLITGVTGGVAVWAITEPRPAFLKDADAALDQAGDPAKGRLIFAAGDCASCHASPGQPDRLRLGGGLALASPYGMFRVPNISIDPVDGIGAWRTVDLANALFSGVAPMVENRTMIVRNEGSLQAHWLDGCRSDPVAGNA